MLILAILAVLSGSLGSLLLALTGHYLLAVLAFPIVGSISALAVAIALSRLSPRHPPELSGTGLFGIRVGLGTGLRKAYGSVKSETLPRHLAKLVEQLAARPPA
jgi:hypothetical protein